MDKAKIRLLCNEIEDIATEIKERTMKDSYYMAQTIIDKDHAIYAEITAPPKTNADRIRQMTDEELASVIGFNECKDTAHDYECPAYSIATECCGACRKHFLKWLKQEVSEDASD